MTDHLNGTLGSGLSGSPDFWECASLLEDILGVSTRQLRSVLPPEMELLLTTEAVWPLVMERLRRLHGLVPFNPELATDPEQWLV